MILRRNQPPAHHTWPSHWKHNWFWQYLQSLKTWDSCIPFLCFRFIYQNQAQYTKETKGSILDSKIKPQSRFKPISGPLWEKYFCLTIHPVILMFLIYYDTIQTNLVIGELPRCFNATNYIALQFKYFARVEQFRLTLIPKWIQDIDNECLEDWEKVCVLLKAISSVFYWC